MRCWNSIKSNMTLWHEFCKLVIQVGIYETKLHEMYFQAFASLYRLIAGRCSFSFPQGFRENYLSNILFLVFFSLMEAQMISVKCQCYWVTKEVIKTKEEEEEEDKERWVSHLSTWVFAAAGHWIIPWRGSKKGSQWGLWQYYCIIMTRQARVCC